MKTRTDQLTNEQTDGWTDRIHLQWFASESEEVEGELEYERDDEVEILFEDEVESTAQAESEESTETVSEDLKNQISSLQEKIEHAKSETTEDRIAQGFDSLSESLNALAAKQSDKSETNDAEQKELQEILSDFENKFYDSPSKALTAWTRTNVAPAFREMQEKINTLEKKLAETESFTERSRLEKSSSNKFVLDTYGDEVDKKAKEVGYEQAIKDVTFNHLDEIVQNKVESMSTEKPQAKGASPSSTAGVSSEGPTKRRVVLNGEQRKRVEELKKRGLTDAQAREVVASK